MIVKSGVRIDILTQDNGVDKEADHIIKGGLFTARHQHAKRDIGLPALAVHQDLYQSGQNGKGGCAMPIRRVINQVRGVLAKGNFMEITRKTPCLRPAAIRWQSKRFRQGQQPFLPAGQ